MEPFRTPGHFLADLGPDTTGRVIASATDVALIVEDGIIRDVALGSDDLGREGISRAWCDRPWIDTVTVESRPKIEHLLRDASTSETHWRQVNHPSMAGADLPIRYTAVQAGSDRVVALGRDLRADARLQQRLVEAHQHLERDYARMRDAEARYHLLFDAVSEPVLVVDPDASTVQEANPAAARVLGEPVDALVGEPFDQCFSPDSRPAVARLVTRAATRGEAHADALHTAGGHACALSASAFREGVGVRVIARLTTGATADAAHQGRDREQFLRILESLPDGLVVAGADQRILAVNRAFAEMTQLVGEDQSVGSRLSDYVGRSTTETNVLISNLRNHGVVRNFATVLRDRFGNEESVEVSAVATPAGGAAVYGLSVRNVSRRLGDGMQVRDGLPTSADRLAGLVGRMPLREIVREATDFIEKLCIEAALEITDDNRASAAEMLGLSRQSLYSKLKRFGLEESR